MSPIQKVARHLRKT